MIMINLHPAESSRRRVRSRRANMSPEQRADTRASEARRQRDRRIADPDGARAYDRDRYYNGTRRERNTEAAWRSVLRGYGLTVVGYLALVMVQGNRCACCGTSEPGRGSHRWCVDHDHVTGEIRGLLCHRCNAGIGMLGDNLDGALRAVAYLQIKVSL